MTLLRRLVCIGFVLLLCGCSSERGLPPVQVLQRSAQASRELQSSAFIATIGFDTRGGRTVGSQGTIEAQGRTQNAGMQVSMHVSMKGNGADSRAWHGEGDIVIGGENEIYVRLGDLTQNAIVIPIDPSLLAGVRGRWLHMQSAPGISAPAVTPDPRFLRMQAEDGIGSALFTSGDAVVK